MKSVGVFYRFINIVVSKWPEGKRKGIIRWYIKNRNMYTNGTSIMGSVRVFSFEKVVTGMACIKIIFPEISPITVFFIGCIYYPFLMLFNWFMGYIWEVSDGYKEEAAWNYNRAVPNRVFIMNGDDVDGGHEMVRCSDVNIR
jgi:hypothetical protein